MTRLPTVGQDAGNWGDILNDYLSQAHKPDGSLKLDVQTIADLKAVDVTTVSDKQQALVAGYSAAGDGGGGAFYYDAGSSDADNGGTILAPNAGSGRWKKIHTKTATEVIRDRTMTTLDDARILYVSSPVTITIPLIREGFTIDVLNVSAGEVTLEGTASSVVLDSGDVATVVEVNNNQLVVKGPSAFI